MGKHKKLSPQEKLLRQQAATPVWLFETWHQAKQFTVDACAVEWNAKLPRFWSPEQNGLAQPWKGERVWCNPPYATGQIAPWVSKALKFEADLSVLLLPVRTDMQWFRDICKVHNPHPNPYLVWCYTRIHWHPGRLHFIPPPGIKYSSPNERHMIVEFVRGS